MSYVVHEGMDTSAYEVVSISELPDLPEGQCWLIEGFWQAEAVGIIGAAPKMGKTWVAFDMAVSVSSGTPFLGRFAVRQRGRVLFYAAEDSLAAVKFRVRSICQSRDLSMEALDMGVITAPQIDLCNPTSFHRLERCVQRNRPRLLVLDPFIRLFSGNEDDSSQVSKVLGILRRLQREQHVAIVVVHHNSKRAEGSGHALRGSGDFHAWADSGVYLSRTDDGAVRLAAQHRSAAAPDPVLIRLITDEPTHLEVVGGEILSTVCSAERNLEAEIGNALSSAAQPLSRSEIRARLGVRNELVKAPLDALAATGRIVRIDGKWMLSSDSVPTTA